MPADSEEACKEGAYAPGDFALVVLHNPREVLYCVSSDEGVRSRVQSITPMDKRYAPYPARLCCIENLCGKLDPLKFPKEIKSELHPVSFCSNSAFGPMRCVHHLDGNVTYNSWTGPVGFKGCTSLRGMNRMCMSLYGGPWAGTVHMGVLALRLGKSVHTGGGCFMERVLQMRFGHLLALVPRLEQNNQVAFKIYVWKDELLAPPEIAPTDSEVKVTGKGVAVLRFSWSSIDWSEEVEQKVLDLGNRIGSMLLMCC